MTSANLGSTVGGDDPPTVELRGVTKRFGNVVANDDVHLSVRRGEVHALLGENGAGKTTLMRILYGLARPDAGVTLIDGRPLTIHSPKDAIAAGIGMVTQHFALVKPMTVTENVVLGGTDGVRVRLDVAARSVKGASERFGIRVDPLARVGALSVGEQQRVEILKALYRDCRVLILDEPTAVLVPQEVEALFATLRRLCADGIAVVFISHKLHEVREISARVTVLRRGAVVGTYATADVDDRELATLMVGRTIRPLQRPAASVSGATVLRVEGVSAEGRQRLPALRRVSFEVRRGEVLGVAGVSGNGQTELVNVLCGMQQPTEGVIAVDDVDITGSTPAEVVDAGVGRIPEDRHAAVVGELSVAQNLALEHLAEFRQGIRLDERRMRQHAEALIDRFAIKARPEDPVDTLSGGNLQKVVLARVLSRDPKVIVVSQPTRGLDLGATEYVHGELLAQRQRGAGVLLVSEDMDEILALSDRLIVVYEGVIVGEVSAAQADPERLGLLMAGLAGRAA
ncbi:ABC-type putative transport system ATPase component [Gaiella occulta]|uniref:ABC-type putative transport system ATPase component n=1 Tax=Gaiella occulta TaxID=1002870 RepID=A0A7M2Z274_9ACTN|nr:ABC transporter ATP-binding protein [Gaiella occulta]RDI75803.1 ABC-type putative transport system ATPase component [Gaiella occulta]